ncbi:MULTISPECIES: Csu type fimbrial protein [Inquilinus]|uniref:Spore coat protein U-like protein n=1 Tax=Inquilinus ginsengisoli TaxID=363840 RepID=A0ABU1K2R8_9PROT|nr:spore coat protein U domain-containing protein [Inquilinus ginsengisoli]MDR6294120.1 spore coat protein U-like protein [Inquilinus ginsengisoli]
MTALLRPLLLALSAAIVLLFASAGAQAQTCTVTNISNFGTTTVDIVPNASATATGQVSYNCSGRTAFTDVRLCAYIRATGNQVGPSDYAFYQTRDTDSRLAWQMTEQFNRRYARDGGGSQSTGGIKLYVVGGGTTTNINGTNTLTLSYLDRQQQDRVRPGTYTDTYQLITKYLFNAGNASCEAGLTSTTGTITTSFTVTSIVPKNCQFENFQNVDFGNWGSVTAAQASSTGVRAFGNVGMRCTYQTPYSITVDNGQNVNAGTRRMKNGTNFLPYQLFQPGCNSAWTTASPLASTGTIVSAINNHQVCAQLTTPIAVAPAAGTYTDLVIVTATF